MRRHFMAVFILVGLCLGAPASAGVNAGFTAQLGVPERIENVSVGQSLAIPVHFQQMTEMKGGTVSFRYDPEFISFVGFAEGPILPDAIAGLSGLPVIGEDGLAVITGGTTLLGVGVTVATPGGLFGTFEFEVIAELPDAGTSISAVYVEVNTSGEPEEADILDIGPEQLRTQLVPSLPNAIFNVVVERKHNGAALAWNTRLIGIDDIARVRPAGSDTQFMVFTNPQVDRFGEQVFTGLRALRENQINFPAMPDQPVADALRELLVLPNASDEQLSNLVQRVRDLDNLLQSRSHVIPIPELPPQTEFEFELVSRSFDGRRSPVHRGVFRTRLEPDLRPLFVNQFDVQVTPTGASVSFATNRPASATYVLRQVPEGTIAAEDTLNEDGEVQTRFALEDLASGGEYDLAVTATLIDAEALVAAGLPADAATKTVRRRFRTHTAARPLAFLGRPTKFVGADRANVVFEVNQPVDAFVDYGLAPVDGSGSVIPWQDAGTLYSWAQESTATLNRHNLTLSNLDASTLIRYKITIVNSAGETFTTDPAGNEQWSQDLKFRTSAAADSLPAEVIRGPLVDIRDVLAIVRFATDVPTAATIYVGTDGGTYETEDEYEFPDLTPDGERRFANRHSIIVSGLDAGFTYRYRLEVETAAGRTTPFEPGASGSGKRAGLRQPPGGAGAFTTSNDPDTQFPVILAGPTVSGKSDKTAIIEWTTDEPADSELNFGLEATDEDSESSAVTTTSHKVTLSNLEAGRTYRYIVGSTDASGNGATQSSEAVFTTDPEVDLTAPAITSDPTVIYKNDENATIQWTTDENASGEVTFGTAADNLGFVRTLPETDQTHEVTLTNLEAATTYFYQVASEDLSNNGPTVSEVVSFTTDAAPDVTLPTISDIAVSASESAAIVTWSTDEAADSFVDFGTVSGILDLVVGEGEDVTEHEITLTNLTAGQTYFYTVGSIDAANNGPTWSPEGSFTTLASADVTPPATPSGVSGTAGSQQVILTWAANTETDLGGYNIYRQTAGTGGFTAIATRVTGTTYTDAGLTDNTEYGYRITAIDREATPNESDPSSELALTPTLDAAPTSPSELSVSGDPLLPTFSFTDAIPFNTGASLTYTIQVSTESDFSNVTDSESGISGGSGVTSWTITRSLTEGQTYYWRVRAVEGSLTGPFTDAAEFTVEDVPLLVGDFDDSGAVDFDDFFLFVDAFGQAAEDFPLFDLDGSGAGTSIDFDDFFAFVDVFGTTAGKVVGTWAFAHHVDATARLRLVATGGLLAIGGDAGEPQDMVRLRIFVDDVAELSAYGLMLKYDPAVLSFSEAREGPGALLGIQGGTARLFRVLDERAGRLLIGNGLIDGPPVSGSGLLAELTFQVRDRRLAAATHFDLQQAFLAGGQDGVRRVVAVESARLRPTAFALSLAYPNPFNPATHIDFALATETSARLVVYDVLGRTVRSLVRGDEALPAGFYSVTWDGRDGAGQPVGNGLYFYRLTTPSFSRTGKMMMLK